MQTGIVIQYNANGSTKGTPPPAGVKTKGTPYIIADNTGGLEQDAKRFDCWNSKRDGTGTDYDAGTSYIEETSLILYAKYTETYYTVTYSGNGETGGTAPAIQTRDIAKNIILAGKGTLTKLNHGISHWNSKADGTGTDYALGSTYTGKADITLYAKWIPPITITYSGNGETGGTAPAAQIVLPGNTYTVAAQGSLKKTNHGFTGWNDKADGTGADYAPGSTKTASANITLYAKWIPVATITYSGNGHTGGTVPAPQTVRQGSSFTVAAQGSLTKTAYFFHGWNDKADGTGADYAPGSTKIASANITLYAQWVLAWVPPYPMANIPGATIYGSALMLTEVMPNTDNRWEGVFVAGRTVTLSAYSVGTHEVSYELWYVIRKWAESKGYKFYYGGCEGSMGDRGAAPTANKKHPVYFVIWAECVVWCNAYTEYMTGGTADCVYRYNGAIVKDATNATAMQNVSCDLSKKGYRLPTEAEWEYAARLEETTLNNRNYASGANKPLGHYSTVLYNGETWESLRDETSRVAVYKTWWNGAGYVAQNPAVTDTAPCGSKAPTPRGLYDMSGNVAEWCWDWYDETIPTGSVTNPQGPASGAQRVARGGDYEDDVYNLLVASRHNRDGIYSKVYGFRLVKSQ